MHTRRTLIAAFVLTLLMVTASAAPKRNIPAGRHPNLAAAQRYSQQAWEKIAVAQRANEFDLDGHAQKAKDLLDQVNRELKLAAEAADRK